MNFLVYISNLIIPLLIFYVVATGVARKKNVYDVFIKGANEGLKTVINIMPTLVGLMVAVGILRASGFLEFIAGVMGAFTKGIGLPSQMVPVIIVKMFSSSAATGLVLDIFKEYGPDSSIGVMTSIMMSCTETIFYTMSIYYITAKVRKTRYTLPGALVATFAGVIASVILSKMMF
ncbi:MAG: spore maturation protein [Clostridiales bacterium]|nr:spore maturation protein [Clostridiales bacterium]